MEYYFLNNAYFKFTNMSHAKVCIIILMNYKQRIRYYITVP